MEFYFQSDQGKKRRNNQDYANVFTNQSNKVLALLADGMGGHQAGDIASQLTVNEIGKSWEMTDITSSEAAVKWLIQKIQNENQRVYEHGQQDIALSGMGTTLEAVSILENKLTLAHVGDSRIYVLREGRLLPLTEDHSLVNELVRSGEITPEMAAVHPRKNIITRSVGMPGTIEVDVAIHNIRPNDRILMCSDGLTNMLSETEITTIISQNTSLQLASQSLIDAANQRGGTDNITVILIDLGGSNHD